MADKVHLKKRRAAAEAEAAGILSAYGCPILSTSAKMGEDLDAASHRLAEAIVGSDR